MERDQEITKVKMTEEERISETNNKTKRSIQSKVDAHRHQLVLTETWSVGMLMGWTDNAPTTLEEPPDFYYVIWVPEYRDKGEFVLWSCVGRFIPLVRLEDYDYMAYCWSMNHPSVYELKIKLEDKSYTLL